MENERYWFNLDELHFIVAQCGPKAQVFHVLANAADAYELEPCRADEEDDASAVLVAFETDEDSGCGHFSRLYRTAEWESMQEAAVNDPDDYGSVSAGESDHSDESSSSSSTADIAEPPPSEMEETPNHGLPSNLDPAPIETPSPPTRKEPAPSDGLPLHLDPPLIEASVHSAEHDLDWESLSEGDDDADYDDVAVDPDKRSQLVKINAWLV